MNFSDNPNFYPTPKAIIDKMIAPFIYIPSKEDEEEELERFRRRQHYRDRRDMASLNERIILEPSAGKGDIADRIVELSRLKEKHIYAIEQDGDLVHILNEKGYNVIGNDFLNYNGNILFDLIIMNPPFDRGEEHLLKAWEILDHGDIVCLLNAETVRNPYSKSRQLLCNIIGDNNGTIEYLGDCFATAERKTNVNVALIRLHKPEKTNRFQFDLKDKQRFKEFNVSTEDYKNQVLLRDTIGNMMIQIQEGLKQYELYRQAYNGMKFYLEPLFDKGTYSLGEFMKDMRGSEMEMYNSISQRINERAWRKTMDNFDFKQYMTSSVYADFNDYMKVNSNLAFTKENVSQLVETLFLNRFQILDQSITQVFDYFTDYHKENRLHIEGWKTNDKWKVNRKVILPNVVKWNIDYMSPSEIKTTGAKMQISYHTTSKFTDIDKCMCYITGTDYDSCYTLADSLDRKFRSMGNICTGDSFDNTGESEFFTYKFWKKGTLHITFKDEFLWQEFNMRACNGKNWLPEYEKKEWQKAKETKAEPINQLLLN